MPFPMIVWWSRLRDRETKTAPTTTQQHINKVALDCYGKVSLNLYFEFYFCRRCPGCRKRRSLRTNSLFAEFPKVPLGKLLRFIFSFTLDDSQRRVAQTLNLSRKLVSQIWRRLQDLCSVDLHNMSILPFGGPGAVVKCDESKFNHKAKVTFSLSTLNVH